MKVIITGSSGMVGKSVLIECLEDNSIEKILIINRNTINIQHPKVREILHYDFSNFDLIKAEFVEYDACFHCMGISSVGMTEADFFHHTFSITKALTDTLYKNNENIVVIYVSGEGTDQTESSKTMWKRVKGKTENYILERGFKDAYVFRPSVILPEKGVKSKTRLYNIFYKIITPLFPIIKNNKHVITSSIFGRAMINVILYPQINKRMEVADINRVGKLK